MNSHINFQQLITLKLMIIIALPFHACFCLHTWVMICIHGCPAGNDSQASIKEEAPPSNCMIRGITNPERREDERKGSIILHPSKHFGA